jgi:hypothetical protein
VQGKRVERLADDMDGRGGLAERLVLSDHAPPRKRVGRGVSEGAVADCVRQRVGLYDRCSPDMDR